MKEYQNLIGNVPAFLECYLSLPMLKRLKNVGYFCGMDFASKDVYHFPIYVSRYDHSLSTALLTWRFSNNKKETIAALFHDVATPCFSHVIDYMNQDYEKQESTEEKTEEILRKSKELEFLLKQDKLCVEDIINFKKYPLVDNNRPKLCADRLDGILITSLVWTKKLKLKEVEEIIRDITVYKNEEQECELGFETYSIGSKLIYLNHFIDEYCHSSYDNYMMTLLADLTKYILEKKVITYDDLYILDEKGLFEICENFAKKDTYFQTKLNHFKNVKLKDIPITILDQVKKRRINPLIQGRRYE